MVPRGGTTTDSADLPTHNLRFSLGALLGSGSGPARLWLTPEEIAQMLEFYDKEMQGKRGGG